MLGDAQDFRRACNNAHCILRVHAILDLVYSNVFRGTCKLPTALRGWLLTQSNCLDLKLSCTPLSMLMDHIIYFCDSIPNALGTHY